MELHYFVKQTSDGRFQAQESQASFGGEHDHPAEIVDGKVVTYATAAEAAEAATRAYNEALCAGYRRVSIDTRRVAMPLSWHHERLRRQYKEGRA